MEQGCGKYFTEQHVKDFCEEKDVELYHRI